MTTFNTKYENFELLVLPFGLTNAPVVFKDLMNSIFSQYLYKRVIIYLDSILIYIDNDQEPLGTIRKLLEILRKNKLNTKKTKCSLGAKEIDYLESILIGYVVVINPHRTSASES